MHLHFDRQGNPLEFEKWANLLEDDNYRVVEQTTLEDKTLVSTIWTGIDNSINNSKQVFETVIFPPDGSTEMVGRWSSEEEACVMHNQTLLKLKE
ncbi:hypothetical protein M5X00_29690 [Paenibacillus alvei]|uniref:hypothetical protein n=1 Tax=Paenibacillus alvei TaxID=44250 RepID=UPI00028A402C|nr:hypothetical protein [Paenibacillus alvei]EJW13988.1 hypothetical protein PAV_141p00940 [Paenibacillus alvei DSM 29]MCY9545139.1 hypothetical protein [Paenibacillus alvei]MCY9707651.1 hypothetical protein [Paenibacillus alvei]MCY9758394.1 hypothetical protein [Paenibacillus alvei]MEC0082837.1 hypothetical protein [Paenibacillus alvei]